MHTFLIDENLSPLIAHWLMEFRYKASAVRDVGLKGAPDEKIIRWLQKEQHILITSDLDFGEFFYSKELGGFGVIVLRSTSQSTESLQKILGDLHAQGILQDIRLANSLLVATKTGYRWRRFEHDNQQEL